MEKQPAIYMLASRYRGIIYIGVTSNLVKRVWEHKQGVTKGFTEKYNVKLLVYYELLVDMPAAIHREKQLKAGSRQKKIKLIESMNPDWLDLYESIIS